MSETTASTMQQSVAEAEERRRGMRRFVISACVFLAVLVGLAAGLFTWLKATSKADYKGRANLAYPEHRYYR